ncbi:MAG: VWA domain-containing protein [Armatimonadetes bacterium]|nr:VWA domain-containing protein [Armatimonadota bacterium]
MSLALSNPLALVGLLLLPYLVWVNRGSLADQPHRRRWFTLGLRGLIVTLLVLALAGLQAVRTNDQQCVFFILDISDSVPAAQKTQALEYVTQALKQMRGDDLAGVIAVGSEALMELSPARSLRFEKVHSTLSPARTDLAAALRLALAAFPEGTLRKIVLLTDGNENLGSALDEANLAASDDVLIDVVPLAAKYEKEVLAEKLVMPSQVKIGEPFSLRLVLRSLRPTTATIRLLRNDEHLRSYDAKLVEGVNSLELPQVIDQAGFYEFQAVVETADDTLPENNRALGFCLIRGQPKVLYCEGDPGGEQYLLPALQGARIETELVGLSGVPLALAELQQYDALILSDVRADLISLEQMMAIRAAVRDLGIGLIMIGGEDSFGVGGYYQTPVEDALPVYMDVRRKQKLPGLAMELIIDKSGSMAMTMLGAAKVDLAKEAAIAAVKVLNPQDEIGVICFDEATKEVVKLQRATHKDDISNRVAGIAAGGGTQMYGAMQLGFQRLKASDAKLKHCILLTDGQSLPADFEGLARQMAGSGITISAVAVGSDSAIGLLQALAKIGKGNFYYTDSPRSIPRIFTRETMLASQQFLVDEAFQPRCDPASELLRGIHLPSMPPLLGHVVTTKKELAHNSVVTPKGDPVLTEWRYGLGRAVAFTSDAKAHWATHWISWPGYRKFWEQVVRWTIRSVPKSPYVASLAIDGGEGRVELEAIDPDGTFVNFLKAEARVIGPGLEAERLPLRQVAPGRYEGRFRARDVGQYIANLAYQDEKGRGASQVAGAQVSYPPEYAELGPNEPLLAQVVEVTGGALQPDPQMAFVKTRPGVRKATDIWPLLAAVALLLFPLDVALRRLMIEREHWAAFAEVLARLAWWRRLPIPAPAGAPLSRLLERKQETQETLREERPETTVRLPAPGAAPRPASRPGPATGGREERMRRLLDAKRRAKPQ